MERTNEFFSFVQHINKGKTSKVSKKKENPYLTKSVKKKKKKK